MGVSSPTLDNKMQVFAVLARVLLVTLAVSAAKLPLQSQVVSRPSTLYEAPLEDIPDPSQPDIVIQTPAEIPAAHAGFPLSINIRGETLPESAQLDNVLLTESDLGL